MIVGIGSDIVNINRIERTISKFGNKFINRCFSKIEILKSENRLNKAASYAKRFAAKEALSKALGTGIRRGIDFKNIEISNNKLGKPSIKLKGSTENFLKKKIKTKNYSIYLSLSDDLPWAQATVIISYK